jgi:hypothetical protein
MPTALRRKKYRRSVALRISSKSSRPFFSTERANLKLINSLLCLFELQVDLGKELKVEICP